MKVVFLIDKCTSSLSILRIYTEAYYANKTTKRLEILLDPKEFEVLKKKLWKRVNP